MPEKDRNGKMTAQETKGFGELCGWKRIGPVGCYPYTDKDVFPDPLATESTGWLIEALHECCVPTITLAPGRCVITAIKPGKPHYINRFEFADLNQALVDAIRWAKKEQEK